jgi:amidophosphoribosyltransferase
VQIIASANFLKPLSDLTAKAVEYFKKKFSLGSTSAIRGLHQDPKLAEKCGVFAYMSKRPSVKIGQIFSSAMQRLQHRGQKACGYAYFTDDREAVHGTKVSQPHRSDPVNELLSPEVMNPMLGKFGIGHTLYATSKTDNKVHTQPLVIGEAAEKTFLVHNGNLPDLTKLKIFLEERNVDIANANDSELIARTLGYYKNTLGHTLEKAMQLMLTDINFPKGAYSLIAMDKDKIVVVRDRYGNKPLTIGVTESGDIVAASESPAFEPIGAKIIRDIKPGEMLVITPKTSVQNISQEPLAYSADRKQIPESSIIFSDVTPAFSAFEYVYFSRPDTVYNGKSVHEVRRALGKKLGDIFMEKYPNHSIDFVAAVPESGKSAAEGFSERTKIPINSVLIKNKHKRTFIEEDYDGASKNGARAKRVTEKFSIVPDSVKGKNILLVDDSIVRSTTVKVITDMFRKAGAASVHFAIPAPPIRFPNFYGIDTPQLSELAANNYSSDKAFGEALGLDSLTFLKPDEFQQVVGTKLDMSDFTGEYIIPIGKKNIEQITEQKGKTFRHLRQAS